MFFFWPQVDSDGSGHITVDELGEALKKCNIDLPAYMIRDIISQNDSHIKDGKLDMEEFRQVCNNAIHATLLFVLSFLCVL